MLHEFAEEVVYLPSRTWHDTARQRGPGEHKDRSAAYASSHLYWVQRVDSDCRISFAIALLLAFRLYALAVVLDSSFD